jgi:hypothetical protein
MLSWDPPLLSALAPYGLLKVEDKAVFERRYVARLERHGLETIRAQLAELAAEHGADGLVLLCFEDLSIAWCHRRMFASWWERQTGERVLELTADGEVHA